MEEKLCSIEIPVELYELVEAKAKERGVSMQEEISRLVQCARVRIEAE